jgi:hypothetical protein
LNFLGHEFITTSRNASPFKTQEIRDLQEMNAQDSTAISSQFAAVMLKRIRLMGPDGAFGLERLAHFVFRIQFPRLQDTQLLSFLV